MVVVMVGFAKHENIHRDQVVGSVLQFVIGIAIFMRKPVDDSAMHSAHSKDGEQ